MKTILATVLSAAAIATSGCVVKVNNQQPCDHVALAADAGNYAGAIRAASTIDFSNERCETLSLIAAKPDIDHPSQIALINDLRGNWGFSGDKTAVLIQLATNPALTPGASVHIANNLERIATFSADRKKVADLLAARPLPTPAAAPAPTK